jgi:hypothetical protein
MKRKNGMSEPLYGIWATAQTVYENYPFLLRSCLNLNYDILQNQYLLLFVVTHTLDRVRANGLPSELNVSGTIFVLEDNLKSGKLKNDSTPMGSGV